MKSDEKTKIGGKLEFEFRDSSRTIPNGLSKLVRVVASFELFVGTGNKLPNVRGETI